MAPVGGGINIPPAVTQGRIISENNGSSIAERVAATDTRLRRLLDETILPFWYPILSANDGAFALNHDGTGQWLGAEPINIVAQGRILWICTRLAEVGIERDFFALAAARALRFLLDRMRDADHGGFHWTVAADGSGPVVADKHLYGQAFALLGLSRYGRVAGDGEAIEAAWQLYETIERHAHDPRHGGYREWFAADWSPPSATGHPLLGVPPGLKTQNVHMHLMDAVRELVESTDSAAARSRLVELVVINASTVQRKTSGYATDRHTEAWRPIRTRDEVAASYGHMAEIAWMIPRAAAVAGLAPALLEDAARTLATTVLTFGFDRNRGGVYDNGPIGRPSIRRIKSWWVQGEVLPAFLARWQATGDETWADAYLRTLAWIEDHQVDRTHGEWHRSIGPDLKPTGPKADQWKCPFHHVRALLLCREMLQQAVAAESAAKPGVNASDQDRRPDVGSNYGRIFEL